MANLIDILSPLEQEGTKATVRSWLINIGDRVAEGDALVELETDKVTQEVPSPVSGILRETHLMSGDNAAPGAVLGQIEIISEQSQARAEVAVSATHEAPVKDAHHEAHYSPAVRRAAAQYDIDPAALSGSGKGGRVTVGDMEAEKRRRDERAECPAISQAPQARTEDDSGSDHSSVKVPHSAMRLAIAKHMVHSLATAPQVTSVFEADFTAIIRHRDANKDRLKAAGISLSYTAYIVAACVAAMKLVPEVNSQWHDDHLEVFNDINIGIGTALGDKGLVVPVLRQTQNLSLEGISAELSTLTSKARANTLKSDDMKSGTFTISNHGTSGSLFAAPIIINQPQAAILGVGKLEKRVVVREVDGHDTMQIRPMAYVSLTIDHRALDGFQTNKWLSEFKRVLESWPS